MLVDRHALTGQTRSQPAKTETFTPNVSIPFWRSCTRRGGDPDYFVAYRSIQPWRKDSIVQLPPFPNTHAFGTLFVATRADNETELPTDYTSNELRGGSFRALHSRNSSNSFSGNVGRPLGPHSAHARYRQRSLGASSSTPFASSSSSTPEESPAAASGPQLDAEQILLHSLSRTDLRGMCLDNGASQSQVARAHQRQTGAIVATRNAASNSISDSHTTAAATTATAKATATATP